MSSEYSFTFILEEAELSQFIREHSRSDKRVRAAIWFVTIALSITIAGRGLDMLQKNAVPGDIVVGSLLIAGGIALPLLVLFSARLNTWLVIRRWRKLRAGPLDEQSLVISEAGIHSIGRRASTQYQWSAIEDIVDRASLVRFMLADNTALILPHRVIQALGHSPAEVVEQAAQWRSKGPPTEDECPECRYDLRGAAQDGCPECGWRRSSVT